MPNVSIRTELDEAETSLTRLCEAIQRKTQNADYRAEYNTLLQQACCALSKVRSMAETDDFLRGFEWQQIGR